MRWGSLCGGTPGGGKGQSYANTLLRVSADHFLKNAEALQTEAFGNESLYVVADKPEQLLAVLSHLEGNLTGCVYSHSAGEDDALYNKIVPVLREKVGRLLNDKMPTGVAVSAAMNHGGPYPATGHAGFTAVEAEVMAGTRTPTAAARALLAAFLGGAREKSGIT